MKDDFLQLMQDYEANISISGSTLRNQGAAGVAGVAREFLKKLNLSVLKGMQPMDYAAWLDCQANELKRLLPDGVNNWGTARKAINVFMVQVFLNHYLRTTYQLDKFKDVLETPLDSYAAKNLKKRAGRGRLPQWNSIVRLTRQTSDRYQAYALHYAKEKNIPRACLDIILWRNDT